MVVSNLCMFGINSNVSSAPMRANGAIQTFLPIFTGTSQMVYLFFDRYTDYRRAPVKLSSMELPECTDHRLDGGKLGRASVHRIAELMVDRWSMSYVLHTGCDGVTTKWFGSTLPPPDYQPVLPLSELPKWCTGRTPSPPSRQRTWREIYQHNVSILHSNYGGWFPLPADRLAKLRAETKRIWLSVPVKERLRELRHMITENGWEFCNRLWAATCKMHPLEVAILEALHQYGAGALPLDRLMELVVDGCRYPHYEFTRQLKRLVKGRMVRYDSQLDMFIV